MSRTSILLFHQLMNRLSKSATSAEEIAGVEDTTSHLLINKLGCQVTLFLKESPFTVSGNPDAVDIVVHDKQKVNLTLKSNVNEMHRPMLDRYAKINHLILMVSPNPSQINHIWPGKV